MTIYSRLRPNIPWIAEGQECSYRSRTGSPIDSIDYNALVQVWVAESRKLSRKSRSRGGEVVRKYHGSKL